MDSTDCVWSVLVDVSDQILKTKTQVHMYNRKETAKLKPPRSQSKEIMKLALKLVFTLRRHELERWLRTHLDDVVVVAVTNFCIHFNMNVHSILLTADDELAAHVKQMHPSQIKQNDNAAVALYQKYLVMIEQSLSLRQQDQQSFPLTKESDYELNDDGIARLNRSLHEDSVGAFANNYN